jgi:hypothetical protein
MRESDSDSAGSPCRQPQKVLGQRNLVEVVLIFPETVFTKEGHIPFAGEDRRFSLGSPIAQQAMQPLLVPFQEPNGCLWMMAVGNDQRSEKIRRGVGVLQEKTTG